MVMKPDFKVKNRKGGKDKVKKRNNVSFCYFFFFVGRVGGRWLFTKLDFTKVKNGERGMEDGDLEP